MIIRCPNCSTTYKVSGSVFDAPQPTFRCTRCKHVFMVQVHLQLTEEESPAAVERAEQQTAETSGTDDRNDVADGPDAPPDEEAWEDAVAEDDVVPPAAGTAPDASEPPPEAIEAADEFPAPDRAGIDVDEEDAGDTAPSYRGFEIDTPETELAEAGTTDPVEETPAEDADSPVGDKRQPDFEIEEDFLLPPTREAPPPGRPLGDSRGSIVPLASLLCLAVLAFVLVALIYQANPQPLDSLIRRIPWYGSAVFDNRHFKQTLVVESLASGVHPVLNQTEVFIVSGKLTNRNDRSVHKVRIEARLFDAEGKQIGQQVTFVGNAISAKIIQDMTFREISLLQSLKPQSNYRIGPDGSANFTIVFPKPKTAVESFSCRVVSAEAAA